MKSSEPTDNNNAISSALGSLNVTNAVFDCPFSLHPTKPQLQFSKHNRQITQAPIFLYLNYKTLKLV
jgi:hypothetical protein